MRSGLFLVWCSVVAESRLPRPMPTPSIFPILHEDVQKSLGSSAIAFSFVIYDLKPEPGGSKRGFVVNRHVNIVDANKNAKPYQKRVRELLLGAFSNPLYYCNLEQHGAPVFGPGIPLAVMVEFLISRPRSHYRKDGITTGVSAPVHHTQRPDATKLWRCLEDALTGIVWHDDAQVVSQDVSKGWSFNSEHEIRVVVSREDR